MKKIKWIMLALVLCLGLVGGAYAYWTDQVVVTGSVGTGSMDVVFSAATATDGDYEVAVLNSFVPESKVLDFSISNLFPKADYTAGDANYAYLEFTIKNNGTIPVKIKGLTADPVNDLDGVFGNLKASAVGSAYDGTIVQFPAGSIQTFLDAVLVQYATAELEAGGERTYGAYVWLADDVTALQGKNASFTITVDLEQFNALP